MERSLLVTGGAGFIGANFVHYWSAAHPDDRIVVADALTYAGNRESLSVLETQQVIHFEHCSILDDGALDRILAEQEIDTIVHFAAESHVDRSITGPDAFIDTNIVGTYRLLNAAKRFWLDGDKVIEHHRFHHVSTDEVYGTLQPDSPAFKETHQYAPNSPYAASKAASDHLVRSFHETYGLAVTTSNCSNNYGPYHFPEKLIPLVITNILRNRKIPVYGDGAQIRDWLYVEDHARGIDRVLKNGRVGATYNIGGNNEWTNIDLVHRVCREIDKAFAESSVMFDRYAGATAAQAGDSSSLIEFVTDRPGHDRRYAIDASRIEKELGFRPSETFDSGITKTVRWFLDNAHWWQPLLRRSAN